uniref:Protein AAR2 homolog n=1 Tax=Salmo trutta TaxID=8032 RepID=A0A674CMB9_SALTR
VDRLELMGHGGCLRRGQPWFLWSVPEGTELGINYKSWQVGSCFQGVKMIPPGLHLLHYCSSNVGRVWVGLQDLDPFLGPYPYELMYKCVSLTSWVNQELATRLQLLLGCMCLKHQEPLHRMKRDGTELRFSPIPRQTYPPGATPAQITQCSPDLSYSGKKKYPLNDLHLCVFSLGPCTYEGFEHGKRLLALLCRSESPDLYLGLIAVLYQQLGEIPPDFSVDIVSQDNYLTSTLQVSWHQ